MIITRIKVIVSPCGMYEEKSKSNGGTNMSISLQAPVKRMGIITKSIHGETKNIFNSTYFCSSRHSRYFINVRWNTLY
jgi:hypothetical protein